MTDQLLVAMGESLAAATGASKDMNSNTTGVSTFWCEMFTADIGESWKARTKLEGAFWLGFGGDKVE